MKRERGFLRAQAKAARSRLAHGFWEIEREKRSGIDDEKIGCYIKQLGLQIGATPIDAEEENLYQRVSAVLCVANANPLSQVLDRSHMAGLSSAERERYVFQMSAKVHKCIERYNQECC